MGTIRRWLPGQLPITQVLRHRTERHGFDFTAAMIRLCRDIAARAPGFEHIDMDRVLVCATVNRKRTRYGLQARVTPMRFRDGALTTRRRGRLYGLERYYVGDREMLYLLTFVVPRFFHQPFEEKLTTVFHELYHIAPEFNGDIRRLGGRCCIHSRSKKGYDAQMLDFARQYLADLPDPEMLDFLRWNFDDYQQRHGGARVVIIPRPRLVPIGARTV